MLSRRYRQRCLWIDKGFDGYSIIAPAKWSERIDRGHGQAKGQTLVQFIGFDVGPHADRFSMTTCYRGVWSRSMGRFPFARNCAIVFVGVGDALWVCYRVGVGWET